jgi:uncharacterized membrane protein YqiK
VQNLVDHVLQPIVGNYFRNAAQNYTVLDFLSARSERQQEAAEHIRQALRTYDVQAIDTLIGDITPPDDLMFTLTERKIAEEQRKTYEVQMEAQTQRQELVRETSLADIQEDMVRAEKSVTIADLTAQADIKKAEGESQATHLHAKGEAEAARLRAETESNSVRMLGISEADAVRAKGDAQGEAYRAGVEAIGPEGFTAIQLMQLIAQGKIRIVPDVTVNGNGNGGSGSLTEGLLGLALQSHLEGRNGDSSSKE